MNETSIFSLSLKIKPLSDRCLWNFSSSVSNAPVSVCLCKYNIFKYLTEYFEYLSSGSAKAMGYPWIIVCCLCLGLQRNLRLTIAVLFFTIAVFYALKIRRIINNHK